MIGGNIDLLTQLYWPTVHPALQEEKTMAKFAGRRGDLKWGKYDYPVTKTQKATLDGLLYMMSGLPTWHPANGYPLMPEGYFCSQYPSDGRVVMGLNHQSVSVHRNGRVTSNAGQ
jgi:hypothetical protein